MSYCTYTVELCCAQGPSGPPGWYPVLSLEKNGSRHVLRIVDWAGGSGTKPTTGYIGPFGIVATESQAQNITPINATQFLSSLSAYPDDQAASESGLARGEWYRISPDSDVLPAGVLKRNLHGSGNLVIDPFGFPLFSSREEAIQDGGLSDGDYFVLNNSSDVLNGAVMRI